MTDKNKTIGMCLIAALSAWAWTADAQAQNQDSAKIKDLENRIAELEGRLEGRAAGTAPESKMEEFLKASKISGYVSASYLYNFNRPSSDLTTGRSFDVNHNEFSLNKFKLVLEKPVEYSGDAWDAGYRADLIFGQDATLLQSAGLNLGDHGDLEQAFVTMNVPIGRGLQISAGKWVTLMGVEVIEEVVNPNWSEGNQFLFVENFTGTGVQLSYKWTDKIDTQFRVYNGWDVVKDNNSGESFMARIGVTPDDKTVIGLVGYAGPEQAGNSRDWRKGVNLVVGRKLTPKLGGWLQLDYGEEDANAALPEPDHDADWYAAGLWLTYDFTDKVGLALRGDYLNDTDGARTSLSPFTAPFPANTGQELTSLTLTLNFKPIPSLQIRPEVRWDHSTLDGAFDGHDDQVTGALGIAYLY